MKRKNATRSALFTSIISLLLCVSMLVGTTFAWFTDSVVSGNNVIAAGNLDIELYNDGNRVTESTNLFNGILWEPGVVDYENFTIKNEGNLALLYDFAMNWSDYNTLAGQYNLTQILKVAMIDGHVSGNREAAIAAGKAAGWKALSDWSFSGEMTTKGETKDFALIIYWEPSDNDNNWNVQNGKTLDKGDHLYVNLGINLQATQKMHESDSFGKDYDALANPWDGSVGEVPAADENNVITLTTGAELAAFAESVNNGTTYSGKTVKLGANINLNNQSWTAIGDCESGKYFRGTFDGQGYTIYNLNVDYSTDESKYATAGLFAWVDAGMATIKNVNIDGATVKGSHWVGVIAGYFTGRIENCSVNDATVIAYNLNDDANGDKVGGIVGCLNEHSYLNNNTVTNSTISGNRDIGGIAGSVAASTYEMKNNKVTNVTINFATSKDYASAGEIVSGRTGYTPNDTNVATNVKIVKSVIVSTAEELAAALKSTDKDIVITLANSIDVPISSLGQQTGGSGEYKLAGEATETITLDLNDKKLNITTTYWSILGAKNDAAVFTIKNGTMTSSQTSGTWNSYDLGFDNCTYVIEDVTFEKAIALESDATLKNVTINESHDYYAIWITADGQTVEINGLTVNSAGRGIKIDEEYREDNAAKVTLKVSNADFNTVKKGAIMVKSATGADITLSNVNIDDVIDATNAVWVDEDAEAYENLVTVTGGTKICESKVITSTSELNKALTDGQTDLLLAAGEYDIANGKNKTLTITGLSKNAVLVVTHEGEYGCDYGFDGSTVTFNGVTFDTKKANGQTWPNYARMNGTFNNCTFNGTYAPNRVNSFTGCTFNVTGNNYNLWIYGASTVSFEDCTFNCDGKSIYVDGNGATGTDVTVKKCTFNDNGDDTVTNKAAIEIGNTYGRRYSLAISETEVNGFAITEAKSPFVEGTSLGTNVWGNKNYMTKDSLNVIIDGTDVY